LDVQFRTALDAAGGQADEQSVGLRKKTGCVRDDRVRFKAPARNPPPRILSWLSDGTIENIGRCL